MNIVIVEDDQDITGLIDACVAIQWPGSATLKSKMGAPVAQLVREADPDLVLLDLGLPDMSGLQVLAEVRAISDVPIIILTAREDERTRLKALRDGANGYITKPFPPQELLARMKALLDSAA